MTPARAAILIVLLLIPAMLSSSLNSVRNDLTTLSRSLVKRARQGDARSQARVYERFRLPDGDPAHQERFFDHLWSALRDVRPQSVKYGVTGRVTNPDGGSRPRRLVILTGTDRQGRPMTLHLHWIEHRGTWFIHDAFQSTALAPLTSLSAARE